MTYNQIEFNKLLETRRANRAQESLTSLRDTRAHEVALGELTEKSRHNVETERQARASLDETSRANLARERETVRSNVAREAEERRSNVARERETHRANVTKEDETKRSNLAREEETHRAAVAQEVISTGRLAEDVRQHLSREAEDKRSHQATEALRSAELAESLRSSLAREAETTRHNRAMEAKDFSKHETITVTPQVITDINTQYSPSTQVPVQIQLDGNTTSTQQLPESGKRWNPHFGDFFDILPY